MVARRKGGLEGWVQKVKGLKHTNWQLQKSHRHVKHSVGNPVNNIVITLHGARWALQVSGEPHCKLVHGCLNHHALLLKLIQNNIECKL